jgi:hypothetical protein
VVRTSVATPAKIMATKKALKRAFEIQIEGLIYPGRGVVPLPDKLEGVAEGSLHIFRRDHGKGIPLGRIQRHYQEEGKLICSRRPS